MSLEGARMERGNSSWETVFVIGLETKVCIKLIAVGMEKMMEIVINRGRKDNRLEVLKHTKESTSLEQSHMQSFSQCKKKVNLLPPLRKLSPHIKHKNTQLHYLIHISCQHYPLPPRVYQNASAQK